jgi:hypothetical protein
VPPFELLLPLIIAKSGFPFIPGPGMFYMSIQTMVRGRGAGWSSAAAFHLGAYVHIFAAAFGVTVLLQWLPFLFLALKLAGAAYLIWMGVQIILDGRSTVAGIDAAPRQSARQAFKDSLVVGLLNPKSALFFLAFLPQFASPRSCRSDLGTDRHPRRLRKHDVFGNGCDLYSVLRKARRIGIWLARDRPHRQTDQRERFRRDGSTSRIQRRLTQPRAGS